MNPLLRPEYRAKTEACAAGGCAVCSAALDEEKFMKTQNQSTPAAQADNRSNAHPGIGTEVIFISGGVHYQGLVLDIRNSDCFVAVLGYAIPFLVDLDRVAPVVPSKAAVILRASERQVARAFTEWERRYREEPERFQSEAEKLLKETPESYGEGCAPYFIKILGEVGNKQ